MQTKTEKLIEKALLALKEAGLVAPLNIEISTEPDKTPVAIVNGQRRLLSKAVYEKLTE
ncbi:MAG: hypothetical protein ABSC64_09250 [Candidatus Korobacteraceae bacterium]|jgi:hypothetical protein